MYFWLFTGVLGVGTQLVVTTILSREDEAKRIWANYLWLESTFKATTSHQQSLFQSWTLKTSVDPSSEWPLLCPSTDLARAQARCPLGHLLQEHMRSSGWDLVFFIWILYRTLQWHPVSAELITEAIKWQSFPLWGGPWPQPITIWKRTQAPSDCKRCLGFASREPSHQDSLGTVGKDLAEGPVATIYGKRKGTESKVIKQAWGGSYNILISHSLF